MSFVGAYVTFHEGPKCLDEGPKCIFQKGQKCSIGADVVRAEVSKPNVRHVPNGNPMSSHTYCVDTFERAPAWSSTGFLIICAHKLASLSFGHINVKQH